MNFEALYIGHCGRNYVYGLVQSCSISIANTLEILQSSTKPSRCDRLKKPLNKVWIVKTTEHRGL